MPDAKPGSQASAPSGRRLGYSLVGVFGASGLRRVLLSYLVFNAAETGTWVAILVWAFDTGGARAAGLIAVVQLVPAMLLAPFGAVIGDRMRRDRALALGYAIQAMTLLAAGTALAVDASTVTIFGLAALASTAIGLTRPVQHAILPEVANTPEELTAGNAASTSVEGLALLLGPLSAGTLLGLFGPGSVFLLFGTLSIGSVLLTYSLPIRRTFVRDDDPERLVKAAFRGLREVAHNSAALLLTFVVGAQFVVVGLLDILVVVLGIDVLHMGQSGPGILTAALGFGTIVGAIATMTFVARRRLSPAVLGGMLLTGLPLIPATLVAAPIFAVALLVTSGLGRAFVDISGHTLLHRSVRSTVLARVFGVQETLLLGGTAVGSALASVLVRGLGATGAFVVTGAFLPAVGALAWIQIRRLDAQSEPPGPGLPLLSAIPMFAVLPQSQREELSRDLIPVTAAAGDHIMDQGDPGDLFFVVESGRVSVVRDGAEIATTVPGGYFGEMALLKDIPRTATVIADTDVMLYALERDVFLMAITGSSEAIELADAEVRRRQG